MPVQLQAATKSDQEILYNLYSLYLHDLSRYTANLNIDTNGSFKFDLFDSLWETEGLSPYFIYHGPSLIGFVLIVERPFLKKAYDYSINDIFILNQYRGKGYALEAIKELFQQNKGKYFVIELANNTPAIEFWKIAYRKLDISFLEREESIDGDAVFIQTFEIK
jgi:predicted acetyltransferase